MPRTKHALYQKQYEEKKMEERRQSLEEEKRKNRRKALMIREKKAKLWDRRYRPQTGDKVLYIERGFREGQSYEERYVAPVTHSKWSRDGEIDFEIQTKDYSNHRHKGCTGAHNRVREENDRRDQHLFFTEKHLTSSKTQSVCYADCFVRHLREDEDYEDLMMKTYFVAQKNLVFPEKRCRYGEGCNNRKVGHLINLWH